MQSKSQSAMEYLTTYGWVLLVIMIVLISLFKLGIFNSLNFAPRAQPGSCQVSRPGGPNSNYLISLQGVCSGQLPQYVTQFNGQSSYIQTSASAPFSQSPFTASFWMKAFTLGGNAGSSSTMILASTAPGLSGWNWGFEFWTSGGVNFDTCSSGCGGVATPNLVTNTWYFVTGTYSGGVMSIYLNGQYIGQATITVGTATSPLMMGSALCNSGAGCYNGFYKGAMANVQIYNTSLSANEIQAQYIRGIGGVPIRPQNLIGWWPLNGDTNDYSGNGNPGATTNVVFTTSWTSGYTGH